MSRRANSTKPYPVPTEEGTVYLIHLDRRYCHAGHYTGFALDLAERIKAHLDGTSGVRFMEVVKAAGIIWHVSRTWEGVTREIENRIKESSAAKYCPDCKAQAQLSSSRKEVKVMTTTDERPANAEPAEYEKGAGTASMLVTRMAEACMSADEIEDRLNAARVEYDPAKATPGQAQWHQGFVDSMQGSVQLVRDIERADAEQRAASQAEEYGEREAG